DTQEVCRFRGQPDDSELLVRNVNGTACRFRRRLPDKLVARGKPSQAWHDDYTSCERGRRHAWSHWSSCDEWNGAYVAYVSQSYGGRSGSVTAITGDGAAVAPCVGG